MRLVCFQRTDTIATSSSKMLGSNWASLSAYVTFFSLGLSLSVTFLYDAQNAGLHSSEFAREAMTTIKVSNVGAYRHRPAERTQLW